MNVDQYAFIPAPLSSVYDKSSLGRIVEMDKAFKKMLVIMPCDLFSTPNIINPFSTNVFDNQVDNYIVQDNKPMAYWLQKIIDV